MHTSSPENEILDPVNAALAYVKAPPRGCRQNQHGVFLQLTDEEKYIEQAQIVAKAYEALQNNYASLKEVLKRQAEEILSLNDTLRIEQQNCAAFRQALIDKVKELEEKRHTVFQEYEQTALATEAPVDEKRWESGARVAIASLQTLRSVLSDGLHLDGLKKYVAYGKVPGNLKMTPDPTFDVRSYFPEEVLAAPDVCRFLHGLLGLATEIEELVTALSAARRTAWADSILLSPEEFDTINILEELGDCQWYLKLMADSFNFSLQDLMAVNLDKLQKSPGARYKSQTFTPEEAGNRDLEAEREGLEKSQAIAARPSKTVQITTPGTGDEKAKQSYTALKEEWLALHGSTEKCGFCDKTGHNIDTCPDKAKMAATPVTFTHEVVDVPKEVKAQTGVSIGTTVRSIRPRLVGYKFIVRQLTEDHFAFCTVDKLPDADQRDANMLLALGEDVELSVDELVAC